MNPASREYHACDAALISLLRIEMAAVETYTQALGLFDDEAVIADLQKIRDEHGKSERLLRDHVVAFGGSPPEGPGPWPAFSSAATAGVKSVGPATTLAALRQGEEHAISEYEAALENEDIHPDCLRAIRAEFVPACRRHVEELNRLLGGMDH